MRESANSVVRLTKNGKAAHIWISVAGIVAVVGLLLVIYHLREYYLDFAQYAPGTEIRPMLEVMELFLTSATAAILCSFCALIGLIMGLLRKDRLISAVAVLIGALVWLLPYLARWGLIYVMSSRHLLWED